MIVSLALWERVRGEGNQFPRPLCIGGVAGSKRRRLRLAGEGSASLKGARP
jgi:hypothetical protein